MTTTQTNIKIVDRPEVIFREPQGSSFRESLETAPDGTYQYSSLVCNGCAGDVSQSWGAVAFIVCGIVIGGCAMLIVGRKLLHNKKNI